MANHKFGFEDLGVWQKAVIFAKEVIDLSENFQSLRLHYRLLDQLEASSTSVSMNIAEGSGRYSKKEFIQFLYIARGSLYETLTLLQIVYSKKWIKEHDYSRIKVNASEIARMLSGLIHSIKLSLDSELATVN